MPAQVVEDPVGPLGPGVSQFRWAFEPGPEFAPLPPAEAGDWLSEHEEPGQTVAQFHESKPNRPVPHRDTIYLLPIGSMVVDGEPSMAELAAYLKLFYGQTIEVLPAVAVADLEVTTRMNDGVRQLLTSDVLRRLRARLPVNAYCLLAVTVEDLYPDPTWNYVFGFASLKARVGVFSLARYDPKFFGDPKAKVHAGKVSERGYKVIAHEVGHMFGMNHCTHYHCLMNGSNHLAELDRAPSHLCPVCLRKLHSSVGFDPQRRYEQLEAFYSTAGLDAQAKWVRRRLERAPATGSGSH